MQRAGSIFVITTVAIICGVSEWPEFFFNLARYLMSIIL